jgi:hypothetical protein
MSKGFGEGKNQGFGAQLADNLASGAGLTNVFSSRPVAKFMTGARVVLRVNGRISASFSQVSWDIQTDGKEIQTIDDYLPHEIAPTRISVTGTLSGFRIPGQGPTSELIQADIMSFLMQKYVAIEVRDSQTNELLFFTAKAQITGRSENHTSENLSNITLKWKAVGWKDERPPELPKGIEPGANNPLNNKNLSPVQQAANKVSKFFGGGTVF